MSAHSQTVPSPAPQSQPSPILFFQAVNAFQMTAVMKAAIELDLFTAIADGSHTADAIALRCQASTRGIRMLCDALTVWKFLEKTGNEYRLSPESSAFLNRHSPGFIGNAIGFLAAPEVVAKWDTLADAVRKGGTVDEHDYIQVGNPIWVEFARSMGKLQQFAGDAIAEILHFEKSPRLKVLDIAAGHGMYGIAAARHNSRAEIVAVDDDAVLQVARENVEKAGVQQRWRALPGNAFDVDFGSNYDVVLVTGFMHHFDPATNTSLLKKVHAALAKGGRVAIVEFVPNDDRVSPPPPALFPLIMLTGTAAGDAYTFGEIRDMLRNAGFERAELHDIPGNFQRLIVAAK